MTGADWVSPAQAAQELREQFPGWTVRAVHGRYEIRIEAHNSDAPGGLYSVTGAYGEVRAELKAARLRALRAAS